MSRLTGIPRSTIKDWRLNGWITKDRVARVGQECCGHDVPPEQYAYLLGIYLGDGYISAHPRDVWRLRVYCDAKYPEVIDAAAYTMEAVRGSGHASIRQQRDSNCVEISLYWKHWPCLFPQHGPGAKHARPIRLSRWQQEIVEHEPEALLGGLIDSDGCRVTVKYREGGSVVPRGRYMFSNRSRDIHEIFRDALDRIGIHWTKTGHETVVARNADVRKLDQFIGFKA